MWKRFSVECVKLFEISNINLCRLTTSVSGLRQGSAQPHFHRISTSSASFKTPKVVQAPLEPESHAIPKEGSYLGKRWPDESLIKAEKAAFSMERVESILQDLEDEIDYDDDMPNPNMINPYTPKQKRCVLCQYNVNLDYKNVRLLSQFVSPYTGRIYGRKLTGLCIPMQKEVSRLIKQSRTFGFMPYTYKKSDYQQDPRLFDPFRPTN